MRTTLSLDDDVLDEARALAEKQGTSFRAVVNQALREGLKVVERPAVCQPYRTDPNPLGLRNGYSLDNTQELLAQSEGEGFR